MTPKTRTFRWFSFILALSLVLSGCAPQEVTVQAGAATPEMQAVSLQMAEPTPSATPFFSPRPLYSPGELVDYVAQTGDTLPGLALRFNTTVEEILTANTFIPATATTMPPGMPMKIPIYYLPLWGPSFRMIPDGHFVNGPGVVPFNSRDFVREKPGWLNGFVDYVAGANRTGAEIVDLVARNFSVSPRLLLALLEFQAGALSQSEIDPAMKDYPLGHRSWDHKGLYLQLTWTANLLNNGYYGYRTLRLNSIEYPDGRLERFDPWINAATASLHHYFNLIYTNPDDYALAVSPEGLAQTYASLFGDPWADEQPHLPGSLVQPELFFPFEIGHIWAMTGGPHTGWGSGEPYAALDFAPPSVTQGCVWSDAWVTAMSPGVVARSETGVVVLDLDGDGDERTGWNIFYLHIATDGRATLGTRLDVGQPLGHPSCEGGTSTGTHVHVARKYNGEWMPADGIMAFNLEGWVSHYGSAPYLGTLTRFTQTVTACTCSNAASFVQTERR